jgi:hypothetical protein
LELDSNLTLVRPTDEDRPLKSIDEQVDMQFVSETDVRAFPNSGRELCVLPVVRVLAVLLTPTCDLGEDRWLFSPLRRVADYPQINRGTLHSSTKGYGDMLGVYVHPGGAFDESFVNFHDIVSVPSEQFRYFTQSRIANLSKEAQQSLEDKLARFLSRGWGFAPGEKVETAGYYKCRACARYYGVPERIVYLKVGESPPKCKICSRGQWEMLLKHKKSKDIVAETVKPGGFTKLLRLIGWSRG